jgi:hypothetical protein
VGLLSYTIISYLTRVASAFGHLSKPHVELCPTYMVLHGQIMVAALRGQNKVLQDLLKVRLLLKLPDILSFLPADR